ncbi:hypothetical protein B0H10DRAFT_1954728 [Mycena sp. CBHHK59/15]|nr:hypothetical protein B0H10DRAFT_1954728 [Mycena sp. CBHHK59/15]
MAPGKSDNSAHAAHNPKKPMQAPHTGHNKSTVSKELLVLAAKNCRDKLVLFNADLDDFYVYQNAAMNCIATQHSCPAAYVRGLLTNTSRFKVIQAVNLRNTLVHDWAMKANEEREAGEEKPKLKNYQVAVQDDIDNSVMEAMMSEEEKMQIIDQFIEYHALKCKGVQATNKVAAMDGFTMANFICDVSLDLYKCTGICTFAFLSCGNPDDMALPHCLDSDDALDFFSQALDLAFIDVLRKFEQ